MFLQEELQLLYKNLLKQRDKLKEEYPEKYGRIWAGLLWLQHHTTDGCSAENALQEGTKMGRE